MGMLQGLGGGNPEGLTPEHVEALIERAGRERVFARARELGWPAASKPELWVWQQIALEVMAQPPSPDALSPAGWASLGR